MLDTLDRLLLKEFFTYFLLILIGLALLFLGIDFLSHFWHMNMPVPKILQLYLYKFPAALQQFVPVGALMATLLVLTTMSRQNEILALYASGVSTLRVVSTFVAAVATVSALSFLVFDSIVPPLQKKQILISRGLDTSQENMLAFNRPGFWYRSGHIAYNVGRFVPESNLLQDVNVYLFSNGFELLERIHAKEARFEEDDWIMRDGYVITYPIDTHFPSYQAFASKRGIIPERPSDFRTLQVDESTMRLKDLRRYIHRNRGYGMDTTGQQVNYHERVALVFTPLVFILLGIPFAITPLKNHSSSKSIAFCFLIVFIYLLMFRMTLSIGKGGHIPPLVAAWAPNLIFLVLAGMRFVKRPT